MMANQPEDLNIYPPKENQLLSSNNINDFKDKLVLVIKEEEREEVFNEERDIESNNNNNNISGSSSSCNENEDEDESNCNSDENKLDINNSNNPLQQMTTTALDSEESSDTSGDIDISSEFISFPKNNNNNNNSNNNASNFLNEINDSDSSSKYTTSNSSTPNLSNENHKGFISALSPRSLKKTGSMSIATESTWILIISNWQEWSHPTFNTLLTKSIYQGIPDRFRATVWFHLSNLIQQLSPIPACAELTLSHSSISKSDTNKFTPISTPSTTTPVIKGNNTSLSNSSNLSSSQPQQQSGNSSPTNSISPSSSNQSFKQHFGCGNIRHKCFYKSIVRHSSEHEEQIKVDINRSFPDIPENLKEVYSSSLYNVLKAISLYDTEMGYCQGISFIGSLLITKLSEEEVFHVLIRLIEGVMRDFYIAGMIGLKLRIYQLSKLVKELFPKLHAHLLKIDLDFLIFASPWFLTAFSYHLSEECSIRVLDVILLQGIEGFFSIGLAIFQIIESDLLNCSDSAEAMEFFRCNAKSTIEVSLLMDTASRISVSSNQLATFQQMFDQIESKPTIPSEFNPDYLPKEKTKDPNWVVKKYKLKERISNLEDDLAVTKQELHYTRDKNEEEKMELLKHLQELSDRESQILDQRIQAESQCKSLQTENNLLKTRLSESKEINIFLTQELNNLRFKLEAELWKNNPKKSIQFEK